MALREGIFTATFTYDGNLATAVTKYQYDGRSVTGYPATNSPVRPRTDGKTEYEVEESQPLDARGNWRKVILTVLREIVPQAATNHAPPLRLVNPSPAPPARRTIFFHEVRQPQGARIDPEVLRAITEEQYSGYGVVQVSARTILRAQRSLGKAPQHKQGAEPVVRPAVTPPQVQFGPRRRANSLFDDFY